MYLLFFLFFSFSFDFAIELLFFRKYLGRGVDDDDDFSEFFISRSGFYLKGLSDSFEFKRKKDTIYNIRFIFYRNVYIH